ncbi:hypothetical protein L2Y96_07300 [Luteibacter aegosomaticola]|uniref:hypothetical protein n=1 Tax=Luteibacter aegosomaticola TaxID=2911538 RepID=UPI001FFB6CD7|nr:hypothetical protein [Luteibacter aegosomaticola]UPG91568.1 hypothetical protein L2Y96_07300 [Luteibacter aegosomaticola]
MAAIAATVVTALILYSLDHDYSPHANPKAHRWSTVTISTSDLPFTPEAPSVDAVYAVSNLSCMKPRMVSGALPMPQKTIAIPVVKLSDSSYAAKLPLDPYADENYDGLGDCHWDFASATFNMKHGPRHLRATISNKAVESNGSETRYFTSWQFNSSPTDLPQTGISNPQVLHPRDGESLHAVTLTAKEATDERDSK